MRGRGKLMWFSRKTLVQVVHRKRGRLEKRVALAFPYSRSKRPFSELLFRPAMTRKSLAASTCPMPPLASKNAASSPRSAFPR
jgi:hypothetical protein